MHTVHSRCSITRLTIPVSPGMLILQIDLLLEHHVLAQERIFTLSRKITKSGKSRPFTSFCFLIWNMHRHTCTHIHIPAQSHTHKCALTNTLTHSHALSAHTCPDTLCAHTHAHTLTHKHAHLYPLTKNSVVNWTDLTLSALPTGKEISRPETHAHTHNSNSL